MLIDLVALVLLALALFKGFRKGLIVALFSLVAYIIGLAAALKLSVWAAGLLQNHLSLSTRWLPFIAFIAVFIAVVLLVNLVARMIESGVQVVMLGWLNRLGGALFFILLYLFIYSIILFYASSLHLISQSAIASSVSYGYIQPLAPHVINAMATLLPFFKNMFAELLHFFEKLPDGSSRA